MSSLTELKVLTIVSTRANGNDAKKRLKKVLIENLGLEDKSPILPAFKQEAIETLMDIFTLSPDVIDTLTYSEKDSTTNQVTERSIGKGQQGWIKAFVEFVRYNNLETEEKLEKISLEEFNSFRIGKYTPPCLNSGITTTTYGSKEVDYFKKGMKRDKSQYSVLRQDSQWMHGKETQYQQLRPMTAKIYLTQTTFQIPKAKKFCFKRNKNSCIVFSKVNCKRTWENI